MFDTLAFELDRSVACGTRSEQPVSRAAHPMSPATRVNRSGLVATRIARRVNPAEMPGRPPKMPRTRPCDGSHDASSVNNPFCDTHLTVRVTFRGLRVTVRVTVPAASWGHPTSCGGTRGSPDHHRHRAAEPGSAAGGAAITLA